MKRQYLQKFQQQLLSKHFLILVDPRQTGKTTALRQLYSFLKEQFKPCAYINFENALK